MTANADPLTILVDLDEELYVALQTLARLQGVPPEEIMRRALAEFLKNRPRG